MNGVSVQRMRRTDRSARRAEAQRVIRHLGDVVLHHRVNDEKGAQIRLWLNQRHRIEWWPGACKWRDPRAGTVQGTAAELVDFPRRQQPAKRRAPRFMEALGQALMAEKTDG